MINKLVKKYSVPLLYLTLTVITILVFQQVRNFDFVKFDDLDYVVENTHVQGGLSWEGVKWAFTTNAAANWHPLTWLSLMADNELFGMRAGGYHVVNVIFHILNTLLLFAVLKKMTGAIWRSAFVAAIFAVHPMHVESVAWVSERKDVLSTLFMMLTLLTYAGYARRGGVWMYIVTLIFFAVGLMAKPMLVTLPFILLLLDYWPLERLIREDEVDRRIVRWWCVFEKIPFFILAGISSVVTYMVQKSGGALITTDFGGFPMKIRYINAAVSYLKYIWMTLWPKGLAVFYPHRGYRLSIWEGIAAGAILVVVTVFVIRMGRRRKYLPVGWLWFMGMMVPVIGLVQLAGQGMADRYTYISSIGLFVIAAWGGWELAEKWRVRKEILFVTAAVVIMALSICAWRQAGYWRDSHRLFERAIDATVDNSKMHMALGQLLLEEGKLDEAMEELQKAGKIDEEDQQANKREQPADVK